MRAVGVGMAAVVKLKYGDSERALQLVNRRVHLSTIQAIFGLSSVDMDRVAIPADDRGFTFMTYLSEGTFQLSGIPAAGLSNPCDML